MRRPVWTITCCGLLRSRWPRPPDSRSPGRNPIPGWSTISAPDSGEEAKLESSGLIDGSAHEWDYDTRACSIAGPAELFIVTDGCFEICRPDGSMMTSDDLRQFLETSWSASPLLSDWFQIGRAHV